MQNNLFSVLEKYKAPIKKLGTYRTDMVKEIMDIINKEREGTKWKKMSYVAVNNKLIHLEDDAVAYTLSICKDSKNRCGSFSKCFFGCLKIK